LRSQLRSARAGRSVSIVAVDVEVPLLPGIEDVSLPLGVEEVPLLPGIEDVPLPPGVEDVPLLPGVEDVLPGDCDGDWVDVSPD